MATKDLERIIAEQSVTIDIDAVKPYPKNPRVGDIAAIQESLRINGQFRPIVVQKSTGYILGGNHTWKAAKAEKWKKISVTYLEVDDEQAKRIVLADNRTNDLASYDTEILADILKSLPSPVGTGYDDKATAALLHGIQDRDADLVRDVVRPPTRIDFDGAPEAEWDLHDHLKGVQAQHDTTFGDAGNNAPGGYVEGGDTEKMRVAESIAALQIQFEQWQDKKWPASNYWGVPDLRSDMLLDVLPTPLDTWGGQDATPDDGVTTWIWNTGVAASKGLPWDRTILSFFTYDTKFQSWFDQPAFQVARLMHNGCTRAIVPDTSFWNDDTRYHHLGAQFAAQWLARFMQECGMKIIPRFMWCVAQDSLVVTDRGEVPIQEVTDQDLVLTRKGWRHVKAVTFMGYKETVTLNIQGRDLRVTKEHKVAVPGGWLPAGALTAHPVSSARTNVGVLSRELMTVGAGVGRPDSGSVDRSGAQVDVFDVDARGSKADKVICFVPFGDGTDDAAPHPMGSRASRTGDKQVAVPFGSFVARPVDAIGNGRANSGVHVNNNTSTPLVPVWDISVEGEHEFIAEGVVVHNCDLESVKVGVLGIPHKPPIAAVCIQAIDKKEVKEQMTADGLRAFVKEIQPEALIIYGGGTAKQVAADAHLPKELTVVHVDNYAHKRRGVVFDNATGKEAVEKAARKVQREAKASAKAEAQAAASTAAAGAGEEL